MLGSHFFHGIAVSFDIGITILNIGEYAHIRFFHGGWRNKNHFGTAVSILDDFKVDIQILLKRLNTFNSGK